MAFNIGYVGLCDRNIKHIYTTTDIKQPATRKPLPYKPEFLQQQDQERQYRLRNRRFMQYYPMHDIELPKALSFRTLPKSHVDDVVSRLMQTSKERFNFTFAEKHAQNDWKQAHEEKIKRLRDVMTKFGQTTHHNAHQTEPEVESPEMKTNETEIKREKRNKRKNKNDNKGHDNLNRKQSIIEKSDYIEKLPPLVRNN